MFLERPQKAIVAKLILPRRYHGDSLQIESIHLCVLSCNHLAFVVESQLNAHGHDWYFNVSLCKIC